jgi:hypothetical protein
LNEVGQVSFELIVSIVMVALDGRFLDRPVHALVVGAPEDRATH